MITTRQNHTLEDLENLPDPSPEAYTAESWEPLPHWELLNTFLIEGGKKGYSFSDLRCHLGTKQGSGKGDVLRMVASFVVTNSQLEAPADTQLSLGVYNQNGAWNDNLPITVFTGLLSNGIGLALESYNLGKHTPMVIHSLGKRVRRVLSWARRVWVSSDKILERLRNTPLTVKEAEVILHNAARTKLLPWSRVGRVDELFRGSCKLEEGNAWDLLLAFGVTNSQSPPLSQMSYSVGFFSLLNYSLQPRRSRREDILPPEECEEVA